MKKNGFKNNALIKRKALKELLNSRGIHRTTPKSLNFLEKKFKKEILDFCLILKQELEVLGKKTLKEKDIRDLVKSQESPEDFDC